MSSFADSFLGVNRRLRGSRAAMVGYQLRRLRSALAYAADRVPFYRRSLAGIDVECVRTVADLGALPVVTKRELRAAPLGDRLARGCRAERLVHYSTTGSTGEPFHIYRSLRDEIVLGLFVLRVWRELGARRGARQVLVVVARTAQVGFVGRLSRALRRRRMPMVSCRQPIEGIVAELRRLAPEVLNGYPSVLARVAAAARLDPTGLRPRLVCTGGEELLPAVRRTIAEGFDAPVRDVYGAHEFNMLAWECPVTGLYHVADDAVALEVLRDGRPAGEGEEGDVVVTGLQARAMPFVRYQLGDRAVRGPSPCPCGRPVSTLERILGRKIDYYTLPDGRTLHHYEILQPAARRTGVYDLIQRYQFIQERADLFVLRVAVRPEDRPAFTVLRAALLETLGAGCEVRLDFVDQSGFPPAGKFRLGTAKTEAETE